MFNNTVNVSGMSISVNGGTAEENSQLCTVVAAALGASGCRNVQLAAQCEFPTYAHHDHDTIIAMRGINPDLFDTPITVSGESEDDMRAEAIAMGYGAQAFAFQVERTAQY